MNSLVLAQDAGGGAAIQVIFLVLLVALFYFLLIRPQRKRAKAQQELAASLEIGQEIRTVGGIHGRVVSLDEDSVVLRIEDGQIRVSRRAVGARLGDDEPV